MKNNTPLDILNEVVADTASHIHDYTKSPSDFTRNRKLNAETTLKVVLNMQGNSLNTELLNAFPDIDRRMTASAFEQAKGKLRPEVFEHIFHEFTKKLDAPKKLDGKYRVFAIDGSAFTTNLNPNSKRVCDFIDGNKPYCQTHGNIMFDLENKIYTDCYIQPKPALDERKAAIEMIKRMDHSYPSIVVMDRGYEGYNLMVHCDRINNLFYLMRVKNGLGGFKEIMDLPDSECDVDINSVITSSNYYYTTNHKDMPNLHLVNTVKNRRKAEVSKYYRNRAWDHERVVSLKFRAVKFKINEETKDSWEVLITNLNRFEFPLERLKELYHLRWDIETSFRNLKYALGAINFHSKKDEFIDMELFAHLTMYNATSACISEVPVKHSNHKHIYAIDFKMACQIVRRYYYLHNKKPYHAIYAEIASYINPVRPGRKDERNLKTRSPVSFLYRVA